MSVRNRYASNCTKVAPFPSSSRLVCEARTSSSRKLNDTAKSSIRDDSANFPGYKAKKQNDKPISSINMSKNSSYKTALSNNVPKKADGMVTPSQSRTKTSEDKNLCKKTTEELLRIDNSSEQTATNGETNDKYQMKIQGRNNIGVAGYQPDTLYDTFPKGREPVHVAMKHAQSRSPGAKAAKREENNNLSHLNIAKQKIRRHSDSQCELRKIMDLSSQTESQRHSLRNRPKSFTNEENFDVPIFRPKSARPSSRWERRCGDEISDDEDNFVEISIPRPKSARPESRILRQIEAMEANDHEKQVTPPPRPTTSRGRRKTKDMSNTSAKKSVKNKEGIVSEQSGSDVQTGHFHASTTESNNKNTDSQNKARQSMAYDKSIHGYDPESFLEEQIKVMNAKALLDLNSGINDIDLDIDPVVYFLQDDDTMTSSTYKPSLSKDALNIIGKVSSEARQKPPIGYHDNSVNKRRHKSDGSQSFYRNDQLFSNSTVGDNEFSLSEDRRTKDIEDKKQKVKKTFRPHIYSDSSGYNFWTNPGTYDSVSDKVISKYSKIPVSTNRDSQFLGIKQDKLNSSCSDQDAVSLRKPRKLEPINGRYLPN